MQIVHFSDIHLSKGNYHEFEYNFIEALVNDLAELNSAKKIDLIVITGDLVDKGGHSLLEIKKFSHLNNPFEVFETVFIEPISSAINIPKSRFLFVPGNHDVDENEILWIDEKRMKNEYTVDNINEKILENKNDFNKSNKRIQKFKEFEQRFHLHNDGYTFSNNQSVFVLNQVNGIKVGFILVNDSWRCSTCELKNPKHNLHLFGYRQLDFGYQLLKEAEVHFKFCLFHHPVQELEEKNEVIRFLTTKDVDFYLCGHAHNSDIQNEMNYGGSCYGFRARAALNKPDETDDKYQPGYQLFDLNIVGNNIQRIVHRKYNYTHGIFVSNTDIAPEGIAKNISNNNKGYPLNHKCNLPKSFDDLDKKKFKPLTE